jgi:uncharacterized protein
MTALQNTLRLFFLLTFVVVLYLVADSIPFAVTWQENKWVFGFLCLAYLMYAAFYLMPAYVLTRLSQFILKIRPQKDLTQADLSLFKAPKIVYTVAVLSTATTTLLLYANAKLFSLYGMYINGFVLNLVMTPGGVESLGGSSASDVGFALIALAFVLLQVALMWLASRLNQTSFAQAYMVFRSHFSGWKFALASVLSVVTLHMAFAYDRFTSNGLAVVAESVPFYQTVSSRTLFKAMGISQKRDTTLRVKGKLNYPLHPIKFEKPAKPYNIIWLTSESWRADTLNETIMPNAWQFAKTATRYTQNYSTGNGTRAGVFGMLMGMPASYWFQFMQEQRGAAIIDVMRQQEYQMRFYTSALFSYPEFDKTIFAQVPADKMQALQSSGKHSWENDQQNITDMLNFIDKRDASKPFFTFMFFESPHARYYFPSEAVIAKPYRDDLNYATLSKTALRADIVPIKNRYINSVHHLDMQFGRVFEYMQKNNLLENTIVILVGDHGEEFMEHGFWGHNSTFVDQQICTPLVIYMPQKAAAEVNQLTSHADIVPTLMPLLGVTNPKADYSIGINLFAGETRDHVYIADWDRLAYVDKDVKIVQPVNGKGLFMQKVSTRQDKELKGAEANAMLAKKQTSTAQIMRDLTHFIKPKNKEKL